MYDNFLDCFQNQSVYTVMREKKKEINITAIVNNITNSYE
jgi:hypothetical protein